MYSYELHQTLSIAALRILMSYHARNRASALNLSLSCIDCVFTQGLAKLTLGDCCQHSILGSDICAWWNAVRRKL